MAEDIAAVDIGESGITVARLSVLPSDELRLLHAGWLPLPTDVDDGEIAKQIRRYWRTHRISTRTVSASLRTRSVSVKTFRYPAMTDSELSAALRLEAADLLAAPREEIVWDWQLTPSAPEGGAPPRTEGVLVAASRRPVDRRLHLLRSAGLYPVRLGVPSLAAAALIRRSDDGPAEGETLCILNLAGRDADIVILSRRFMYPRTVHRDQGVWTDAVAELAAHVSDAVRYCRFSLRQGEVRRVWLTGSLDHGMSLAEEIATRTRLEVALWDPIDRLGLRWRPSRRDPDALERNPTALTVCLGLALPAS